MKKTLLVLVALCMAGVFSAKAQSPSDSAYARDLSYTYINAGSLPYSHSGDISISADGKILKDIRPGYRATAYTFVLTSSKELDIALTTSWDSYMYVLDTGYNVILHNDDWWGRSARLLHQFPAGQYYIIVTEYSSSSSSTSYTLSVSESSVVLASLRNLTYAPLTIGTPVTDTLKTTDGVLQRSYSSDSTKFYSAVYARAFTTQISSPGLLSASTNRTNRYVFLTDNNNNDLTDIFNYSFSSYYIQTPGTYRIIVTSSTAFDHDTSVATPFTLSTTFVPVQNYNTLTYVPLGTFTDTTVNDTFTASFPIIELDDYFYRAKGYSFQGTQGKVVSIEDENWDAFYVLMDNNHNIIKSSWYKLVYKLPQTGTYYLAILDEIDYECHTSISMKNIQTYYVDGINGNDSRNGLTPGTAFATLDTAVARSGGVGKYYLTEDYTFSGNSVYVDYAQIYPYQKDIRLYLPASGSDDVILAWPGHLVFGEEGSSYFFIIDSNRKDGFDDFLDADAYGSYLEVNNLKITNSRFHSTVFWGDNIILRNCEFTNDTIGEEFIGMEENADYSIKFINCNISQNIFDYYFIYFDYDSVKFTMENTNIVGNTFDEEFPLEFYGGATVNLTSGNWRNNRLTGNYYYNGNPNITAQNAAGIWLYFSTMNFGAGFTMDANNYLCIDSASTLNITENLTASNVAQIYPTYYDNSDSKYKANYYEGRRVLWGTSSMLANNYQKFSIAQADNSALWYLHPDGTIHSYSVGIETAENSDIRIYPNPANNVLNIALQGTEVNEAVVIDIYGKTVAHAAVAEGNNTLNISALPAGMYFVQLRADNSVKATQKIIKR
ncbi:MAG: T9SS type A sorting domain-containing protein [Bacteroidales bacterium]|nr:T9SS type A sorting domain-containing protein [Bacteroidales bacterium]